MKRALTISSDYRRHWDASENDGPWWPMLREFAQGAIDEEIQNPSHTCSITYDPRRHTLKISSLGVKLPFSILLLGESTKMDDDRTIGGYGEGLKIALLVAVRNQIPVTIRNGADEVWIPTLEPDDAFPDKMVLKVEKKRQVRLSKSFDIEVVGVTPGIWEMFQTRVLRKTDVNQIETDSGSLLTAPQQKGNIYIKGIYIYHDSGFSYGYNLLDIKPDLDRRMTDRYDLLTSIIDIWRDLAKSSDKNFTTFYNLLKEGKDDLQHSVYLYDEDIINTIVKRFFEEYGSNAIPVLNLFEANDAETYGKKGIILNNYFVKFLTKGMPSLNTLRVSQSHQITESFVLLTLPSATLCSNYVRAINFLQEDFSLPFEPTLVSFKNPEIRLTTDPFQININCLETFESALGVLIEVYLDKLIEGDDSRMQKTRKVWEIVVKRIFNDCA